IQFLQDFLALAKQMEEEQKGDRTARRQLGRIYARLGDVNDTLERYASATGAFKDALRVQEGLVKDDPKKPEYRADLALTYFQSAQMLRSIPRHADARKAFERAILLQDELVKDFPSRTADRARQRKVTFRFQLANMLEEARQPA